MFEMQMITILPGKIRLKNEDYRCLRCKLSYKDLVEIMLGLYLFYLYNVLIYYADAKTVA